MIPPLAAAWEVHEFLTAHQVNYAIIGGLAVQFWGEPRLTVDADLTVATPLEGPECLVRQIVESSLLVSLILLPLPAAHAWSWCGPQMAVTWTSP